MYYKLKIQNLIQDISELVRYDILGVSPPPLSIQQLTNIPKEIELKAEAHKEGIILEAKNLPGFIVSAKNPKEILDVIWDGLLVYFDIPRYYIKRLSASGELRDESGKVIIRKEQALDTNLLPQSNKALKFKFV